MDKQAVRQTLDQLAAFLVVKGEKASRVRAMQHAARSELLATGRSSALDELREQVPPGLAEMLRIPGLGAAKVRQIHELLGIEPLAELEAAAREALVRRLGEAPGVIEIAGREGSVTLRCASGTVVEVLLTTPERFGLDWIGATGSPAHVAALETRARQMGISLSAAFSDEPSLYRALGLTWVPPELREGTGELEAAANDRLPHLVEQGDLRGFLHCHSNYSDGTVTIADWAAACSAAGYEWVGITDHSKSAAYAGGLGTEDVAQQHLAIDAVNARVSGIRVLKGVEADILADGTLDYGPDVLDRFDFVIGSIHSRFGMSEAEMTRRVLTAMDDPHLAIIGHPTGRLLLQR